MPHAGDERRGGAARLAPLAPSRRSLAVGLAILAAGAAVYYAARESSAFGIDHVQVVGASPDLRRQVERAAEPLLGTSLLALDGAALERRLEALPTIVSATYDRAFPHTLRIRVVPERPVAVVRRGTETWLVSARARVLGPIARGSEAGLPRIWLPRRAPVATGDRLDLAEGGAAARAVALATRFPARITTATLVHGRLALQLRSGLALLLGEPSDVRLKLAIARRALAALPPGAAYLDVSVPGRPVAGTDSKVSGLG